MLLHVRFSTYCKRSHYLNRIHIHHTLKRVICRESEAVFISISTDVFQEQQLYLREIMEACVGQDDRKRQEALQSLEVDTGLQAVLPRLIPMLSYSVNLRQHYI